MNRKKKAFFSIIIGLILLFSLYFIFLNTIKKLPFVEKVDGVDGKISTEKIREKYQIDTSANGVISDVWGAQTRSIDLPFYHTKTYFTFNKIKNHNSFTNMQLEIVEDGNEPIRLDKDFSFKNKLHKIINEYKYDNFEIVIHLLVNKDIENPEISSQLFVSMDNRITIAKTYLLLDTTYSHPNIEDPIDDTFEKEAIDLVNNFIVEK